MLVIGLMTGTSMDGIDGVVLETDGEAVIKQIVSYSFINEKTGQEGYPFEFKYLIKAAEFVIRKSANMLLNEHRENKSVLFNKKTILNKAQQLNFQANLIEHLSQKLSHQSLDLILKTINGYIESVINKKLPITLVDVIHLLTKLHKDVIDKLKEKLQQLHEYKNKQVQLISAHGQTVYHNPQEQVTIQIGDGAWLAQATGIPVIDNHRSNDMAHGGQGAPFAPLYHQALMNSQNISAAVMVNLGGIANVSVIAGSQYEDIKTGFDTGPANFLLDKFVSQFTQDKAFMDKDGHYGLQGKVNQQALAILYAKAIVGIQDNYLRKQPPKSLDTRNLILPEEFLTFFPKTNDAEKDGENLQNACATLAAFTGFTVAESIKWFKGDVPKIWILAGGGAYNLAIRKFLQEKLSTLLKEPVTIKIAKEAGFDNKYMEAEIFAWMGPRSLKGLPLSIPQTTGVPNALSGGQLYLPANLNDQEFAELIKQNPAVLKGYQV